MDDKDPFELELLSTNNTGVGGGGIEVAENTKAFNLPQFDTLNTCKLQQIHILNKHLKSKFSSNHINENIKEHLAS